MKKGVGAQLDIQQGGKRSNIWRVARKKMFSSPLNISKGEGQNYVSYAWNHKKTTLPIQDILGVNFYIWSKEWEKSKSIFQGQILFFDGIILFKIFVFFMVKYLGKGEKSCIFNAFLQLHPGVVRVNFFSNSIPLPSKLQWQFRNGLKMFYWQVKRQMYKILAKKNYN